MTRMVEGGLVGWWIMLPIATASMPDFGVVLREASSQVRGMPRRSV